MWRNEIRFLIMKSPFWKGVTPQKAQSQLPSKRLRESYQTHLETQEMKILPQGHAP